MFLTVGAVYPSAVSAVSLFTKPVTVTSHVAETVLSTEAVAFIVAVPNFLAVTTPVSETIATDSSELVQIISPVFFVDAVILWVVPYSIVISCGCTDKVISLFTTIIELIKDLFPSTPYVKADILCVPAFWIVNSFITFPFSSVYSLSISTYFSKPVFCSSISSILYFVFVVTFKVFKLNQTHIITYFGNFL